MEFNDKDLMAHIYIALLETLETYSEIKTLSQLFAKTVVPLIRDVYGRSNVLTANIIKKVRDDLEKRLKEDGVEHVEPDIVKIDSDIKALEAEIDAQIFKLYELNEDNVMTILSSLKVPTTNREMIMNFFRKLTDEI
jgi:predicted transcriptional regulator